MMNNTRLSLTLLATQAAYASAQTGLLSTLLDANQLDFSLFKEAPPLPGIAQNGPRPKIILAQDINYPPFATLDGPQETGDDYELSGMVVDVIDGMSALCGLDIIPVQTNWADCWHSHEIGRGLENGHYHGCMSYTHTKGVRNRYLEFTHAIIEKGAAGILTRLDNEGVPIVTSMSDLDGVKIVDISGWAPTSDGIEFVKNDCTGNLYSGYEMLETESPYIWQGYENGSSELTDITLTNDNDIGLAMLLDEKVDAVWIYADQAQRYQCNDPDAINDHNCEMWSRFGTEFAYVQTGMFDHTVSGTTVSMHKKGSGLSEILNPCLDLFLKTPKYREICKKHDMESACIGMSDSDSDKQSDPWTLPTSKLAEEGFTCSDGYCSCELV